MPTVRVPELYTHSIVEVGNVRQIQFFMRAINHNGVSEWHYFGVTEAERPRPAPNDTDDFNEYAQVLIPQDLSVLETEENEGLLYQLAIKVGPIREGFE